MSQKRPNILWICTDQQRYDTIAALGYPAVSTPVVDRLVHQGVAFDHAYCQSPICTPSRASFLTGTYASVTHNNRNGNDRYVERYPLVTRLLAYAGYDCGLIGKLHLSSAYGRIEARTDDGYRYWEYSHAPRDDWPRGHGYADWVRSNGSILGEITGTPDGVPAELHQTTWAIEKTMEFIDQPREGPWLASVNIYDPHPPFNCPRTYRDQFSPDDMPDPLFRESDLEAQERLAAVDFQSKGRRPEELDIRNPVGISGGPSETTDPIAQRRDARTLRAAYCAMIKLIDDQVGRLLDHLEESGQAKDTLVIFMSDHGEMLGDHGLIQKGCRFYEGLVRVPLIFRWPGQISEDVVAKGLVELTDIAPTLLEAAGLGIPDWMSGRSLLGLLRGEGDPDRIRDAVRCEYYDCLDEPDGSLATMYRDERYKLVVYHGHGLGELFDLQADPGEFENLWDNPNMVGVKADLLQKSFDASILPMDRGTVRIGPM